MRRALIIVVSVVVALSAGAGWFWLDRSLASPLHQARECRVAAQIARSTLRARDVSNRKMALEGFSTNTEEFDPMLRPGASREGVQATLSDRWPERLQLLVLSESIYATGAPLDCSEAFREQGLPVARGRLAPIDWRKSRAQLERLNFARILFSLDGRTAYVVSESYCGPLCGSGWDEVWRRDSDHWELKDRHQIWVS